MIADSLLTYRQTTGLTQADVANLLSISRNYLSQIERGEINEATISLGIYRRICDLVGYPDEAERKRDTLSELFAEMYTAYIELAGVHGCDDCMTYASKWLARYTAVTGHVLRMQGRWRLRHSLPPSM